MLLMRLGVVKPLEMRKFIVASRQYLGSTENEVIEMWKNIMVSARTAAVLICCTNVLDAYMPCAVRLHAICCALWIIIWPSLPA